MTSLLHLWSFTAVATFGLKALLDSVSISPPLCLHWGTPLLEPTERKVETGDVCCTLHELGATVPSDMQEMSYIQTSTPLEENSKFRGLFNV